MHRPHVAARVAENARMAVDEKLFAPDHRERILFVCTANIDRSRTAEDLYRDDPRFDVMSAGVAPFATRPVTRELLQWAERVFVMNEREDGHVTTLRLRFPGVDRPVHDLDVPDLWRRGHPDLVKLILARLARHLGAPQGPGAQS